MTVSPSTSASPLIFLVAGENSGDALGASLMRALSARLGGRVGFVGVGGPEMKGAGLDSLFAMEDLSVMGLFEILPRLRLLLNRIKKTSDAVEALKPDVLVTIDAPDFCFRVIKKLKARGVKTPVIHYVAPSVWAWRAGRAAKVARFLDHLLCLLPFEPPFFEKEGLEATFVGHPVVESDVGSGDGARFRHRHNIGVDAPLLCLLPGSRAGEVERLLPVFGETATRLTAHFPTLRLVVPTLEHVEERVRGAMASWAMPVVIVGADEKADAFAASDVALAASGTVALELAMAGLAHVIAYRLNPLSVFLVRRLIKIPYVNLINIILRREAVPEFLQERCTADNLARETARLLGDAQARDAQISAAREALRQLGLGGPAPGERAGEVVLRFLQEKGPVQN